MASSSSSLLKVTTNSQTPVVHVYNFGDGVILQVKVNGSTNGCNAKVEFQLKNCSKQWILHWGGIYRGQTNWVLLVDRPNGTTVYKQQALQTPFVKSGDAHLVTVELRDPKVYAVEFVLKDERQERWLKLNHQNFRVEIPNAVNSASHPPIPKDLVERKAFFLWESMGRPRNSPEQQQKNYELALQELQSQLSRGISLNELQNSFLPAKTKKVADSKEPSAVVDSVTSSTYHRRHDVGQWLHKRSQGQAQIPCSVSSGLINVVEKAIGGESVVSRQSFQVGNHEIVVILRGDYHVLVATNMQGTTVLHWGLSKFSGEWLAPPPEMVPKRSKLVDGACQTYFNDMTVGEHFFQWADIDLQRRNFTAIQFILWDGGSWIKNNGLNFCAVLNEIQTEGEGVGTRIIKWLLDEISQKEKEAERSLMHRFNIATELTERCKGEGELGLIGIMVWLRFMACRQLTWNKNYNVKPRTWKLMSAFIRDHASCNASLLTSSVTLPGFYSEISAAQDKFTNLLQRTYSGQPDHREILRLIMVSIGRGGQGDVGQRIRDEILVLQRNNDCKGGMMEEWHQKLHNNSSPDDVIICQALLDYVRSGFHIDIYWRTLNASSLTKDILRSYDRPIVSEPRFRADSREGLLRDLTSYLKTLKAVHTGADLESAIDTCLGYSAMGNDFMKGVRVNPVGALPSRLQEYLSFVKMHVEDKNIGPVMEGIMFFISLMLQNLCLSTVDNEDLIYCTKDWYRVCDSYKPTNEQWALQAKAVIDRMRLALSDKSQYYQDRIQPSAQYLGNLLSIEKWAIDIFTEELIRSGSATVLSLLVNRLDPVLRKIANLGCWQVISPVEVCGFVTVVKELITIQSKVYKKPTIILADKVSGEEEIPDGVVGVLTPDMPDVLSHVSVRARNSKVCFATCFDQSVLRNLKLKEGKVISIQLRLTRLVISDISSSDLSLGHFISASIPRGATLIRKNFGGKYALAMEEFTSEMVGAKSRNIQYLRGRVPSWIKIPTSVVIPFGVFETILASDLNKINELRCKMRHSRIPWPGDEGEERWNQGWQAIKKVWASKWNQRAYISCRKGKLNHDHICMSVLIQEVISADYAFVIHTRNPLSGDSMEIYTEIVKGLGETLVGAYAGRAMSFVTKKSDLKSPIVVGYPSKQIGLFIKKSLIFRSDSNGEDLEGYAGAGLYDSVPMDKEQKIVLDYSCDRLLNDKGFQHSISSKIAEVGKIIEDLYRSAQDIEGVVKDGEIYVVQTRPQI
ncbi:hypothetical protein IFM89_008184 [Coptis chinensis]|uniref:Pyruvate phosphate dikinase AMP/ATP-binding domain-containing protein n=1 Tax=Coptis chinensis TaxID=261450 RepID=A0A835LYW7_9MAGN|nr:hypothetical protein IFM89_008184 [Coptis chinensis]